MNSLFIILSLVRDRPRCAFRSYIGLLPYTPPFQPPALPSVLPVSSPRPRRGLGRDDSGASRAHPPSAGGWRWVESERRMEAAVRGIVGGWER
ncbi:hypothetical protein ALC60_00572 [Trachymyrmex zeteki]|uniref:Uncharacterized protein n=1 Tax=Mycetomoellerius zeteki TaxID=64791 RepID=A0A151XID9_9HYME|nr:hypothetical protein ALC60_00572 [Trachymyrmex zeteki]